MSEYVEFMVSQINDSYYYQDKKVYVEDDDETEPLESHEIDIGIIQSDENEMTGYCIIL